MNRTRAQLVQELLDQGHEYLSSARAQLMIDQAVGELTRKELWEFRIVEVSFASGDVITALGTIDECWVEGSGVVRILKPATRAYASGLRGTLLGTSGTAKLYYRDATRVFTDRIDPLPVKLRHYSRNAWTNGGLVAQNDNDTPLFPDGYDDLVVLAARVKALNETDEPELRAALLGEHDRRLAEAMDDLERAQTDEQDTVVWRGGVGDWA